MRAPWVALLILSTILGGAGCREEQAPIEAPPRPVIVHEVEAPSPYVERSFSGATSAADSAELGFEVSGRITRILAVQGRRYETGAVLAELDVSTYEAELRSADAEALRANEELRRVQQLFETDNASRSQFDSAMAAQRTAAAALTTAKKRVEDGTIRMPYTGTVGDVLKEEQEFVSAGTGVIRIQGDGGMEMQIGIPAELIAAIEVEMKAQVRLGSLVGVVVEANVAEVSTQVSSDTTYAVTLALDPEATELREGMDGEATFNLPNPRGPTLTVPFECVVGGPPSSTYLWVVDPTADPRFGTVVRREVRTGALRTNGRLEVHEGVQPGDLVVLRGAHRVVNGTRVRIERRAAEDV